MVEYGTSRHTKFLVVTWDAFCRVCFWSLPWQHETMTKRVFSPCNTGSVWQILYIYDMLPVTTNKLKVPQWTLTIFSSFSLTKLFTPTFTNHLPQSHTYYILTYSVSIYTTFPHHFRVLDILENLEDREHGRPITLSWKVLRNGKSPR